MAYFLSSQDGIERGGKIAADVACAVLIGFYSFAYFGVFGGIACFLVAETALLSIDWLVPPVEDSAGVAVR